MAKFNGLFGKMRGKYGGGVFAVIKGQNILREYNGEPANPRSYAQQAQRALLANMTKFYKRGTQNYYKFAFEDRTTRESDYNAFARHNVQQGVFFSRQLYDNPACPALGDYLMTKGSLTHNVRIVFVGDKICFAASFTSQFTTIGQLSAWILAGSPALQEGDIFTLVMTESDLVPGNTLIGTTSPTWETIQFFLDPSSTETLASYGIDVVQNEALGTYGIGVSMNAVDRASFAALTFSRNTSEGLLVSNTEMVLSPAAKVLIDWNRGDYAKRVAAISWGGNPEAFLQGGQLRTLPDLTQVTVANVQNTPYAYGSGKYRYGSQSVTIAATLTGAGLKTTAQGGQYKFKWYNATAYLLSETLATLMQPSIVIDLEATGTATSISLSGTGDTAGYATLESTDQAFGLLEVDGVPVWWGLMLPYAG